MIFSREKPTDVLSAHFINEYNRLNNDNRKKVVFTASFDFFPNIDAANYVLNAAKSNNDYCYILAGRKSTTLNLPDLDNLFFSIIYLIVKCHIYYLLVMFFILL